MSSPPTLLAFDTSTEQLAIALLHGNQMWVNNSLGGAAASATLLPRVQLLLAQSGLTLQRLDAVAFGIGPGAFTGLRTSCAVAQGLGFGLGCPLLAIDSLLIVAEDARAQMAEQTALQQGDIFDVVVAVDARMEQAYVGHYACTPDSNGPSWQTLRPPALLDLQALREMTDQALHTPKKGWRAGSAWQAFGERAGSEPGASQFDSELDRAAALGRLAGWAWQHGPKLDPADALPSYLRDKVALTTQERLDIKAAASR